uniref:RxLR effector protein n=1 Tax=Leptocylindrus danicus TaxID=163516 RepID=A0A6U2RWU3_9STRA|mmetsp:Transcript_4620/g.6758  ORF Transcript_4620/g.6758 Transcript_4620/m.6758 type:complete len:202 (+) Transcript_4620:56-661(+)|eukprot:CAMPEP_0116021978 /NCGR_PEP_ID=MMETSP0321-20121206/10713_1 /TAXON_ID=163516 /ORGANISM="Leptocylindrus danicus var. danicus, Strain B650" /LENGTH=201 /DNA_ID=CAMNT_0003492961 /DNA_START=110 /DNA_END=715 /DNA_ORIENTATION=-
MKTSFTIFALASVLALTSASNKAATAIRAGNDNENKVKKVEEVTDEKGSNYDELEISEEELAQSIFVPDEFVNEFENMVVKPFNEDEMDMEYDLEFDADDENDRRKLWKKRRYRVLLCRRRGHGGKHYRKLQISKSDIDESKEEVAQEDQKRGLWDGGYGYGGHGHCFKYHYYKCCFRKRRHHYNGYKESDSYGSDSYDYR